MGYNNFSSMVKNCYNTGTVYGSGNSVGGVVGYNFYSSYYSSPSSRTTVANCYNRGAVEGASYVGGVVGWNYYASTVENCYNTATVSGSGNVGGIVGWNNYTYATVSDCIFDSSVYSGNAVGLNGSTSTSTNNSGSATLKATMTGGSFSETLGTDYWKEDSTPINNYYPILIWQ